MSPLLAIVALAIAPWSGTNYSTTDMAAVRYRLTVTGKPGTAFDLRADGVAQGWIAAFCTARLCSPQRVDGMLPASGHTFYAFELFRENSAAAASSGAIIRSADGASLAVPRASRPRPMRT